MGLTCESICCVVPSNRPFSDTIFDCQTGAKEPSLLNILVDGKILEIPSGVIDVKGSFGESAILLDSHGENVRTDDAGMTLQPLHAGESYRLTTGYVS
jgi:hypothetical protein